MDRIIDEFKDITKGYIPSCDTNVGLLNKNGYRLWKVTMSGPSDTSYKETLFFINVKFPEENPLKFYSL